MMLYNCNRDTLKFLVYVYDIIITENNCTLIQSISPKLNSELYFKELNQLGYFLGVEVTHTNEGIYTCQTKYIAYFLDRVEQNDSKEVYIPMITSKQLSKHDSHQLVDGNQCRTTIEALQYCTLTCPKISFVVNKLCQIIHIPTNAHWVAVKRLLRYLLGTKTSWPYVV